MFLGHIPLWMCSGMLLLRWLYTKALDIRLTCASVYLHSSEAVSTHTHTRVFIPFFFCVCGVEIGTRYIRINSQYMRSSLVCSLTQQTHTRVYTKLYTKECISCASFCCLLIHTHRRTHAYSMRVFLLAKSALCKDHIHTHILPWPLLRHARRQFAHICSTIYRQKYEFPDGIRHPDHTALIFCLLFFFFARTCVCVVYSYIARAGYRNNMWKRKNVAPFNVIVYKNMGVCMCGEDVFANEWSRNLHIM